MTTAQHTNGATSVNAPYFPGALSNWQAARFNGDEATNRIIYGTYWHMDAPLVEPDAEIAHLVSEIRQLSDEAEAIETQISTAKDRLRALLTARGENWTDENGYARIAVASTRRSYNADALDKLMLNSKWWDARLRPYRREFDVRSSVQVK